MPSRGIARQKFDCAFSDNSAFLGFSYCTHRLRNQLNRPQGAMKAAGYRMQTSASYQVCLVPFKSFQSSYLRVFLFFCTRAFIVMDVALSLLWITMECLVRACDDYNIFFWLENLSDWFNPPISLQLHHGSCSCLNGRQRRTHLSLVESEISH